MVNDANVEAHLNPTGAFSAIVSSGYERNGNDRAQPALHLSGENQQIADQWPHLAASPRRELTTQGLPSDYGALVLGLGFRI
jgi:hypothetical protein